MANDEQGDRKSYVVSGFPPGKAQLSLDELYAYEPDRESSERQRIFTGSTPGTLDGYYHQAREREERHQKPVRHRE